MTLRSNLAARVRERCHRQHAARFNSMTFDAFAKGLIDRFGQSLPDRWRPSPDYEIMFPTDRGYRDYLRAVTRRPAEVGRHLRRHHGPEREGSSSGATSLARR